MNNLINKFENLLSTGPTFNVKLGGVSFSPTYINVGLIIFLIFLLILTLAQVRRHFVDWSFKGAVFGIFIGFLLALILEGFLLVSGKTAIIGLLGWKNPPKPISKALDTGRNNLLKVLGVSNVSVNSFETQGELIYNSLSTQDREKLKEIICK